VKPTFKVIWGVINLNTEVKKLFNASNFLPTIKLVMTETEH
jgi:hypothetical protein